MLDTRMMPIWLHAARHVAHSVGMVCPVCTRRIRHLLDCHDQDE
jgi:hypothetical protein